MKLASYRRIITQDFEDENQELIEQLGSTINDSFNSVYSALNKRITLDDNIAATRKEIIVTVDSSGIPTSLIRFNVDVPNTTVVEVTCGRARNITNPTTYPSSGITVSFTQNGNSVIINHITGLTANQQWKLIVTAWN
jgi:hypothetical protein